VFVGRAGAYDKALQSIKNALNLSARVIVFTTVTDVTFPGLNILSEELDGLPIIEHRLNIVRPVGRVRAKRVSFNSVLRSVKDQHWSHKLSIKRLEQPFLFISYLGRLELRHARSY
jgi:MoaA/NifB/PqqE/SkfB family radical SAM enzyme